jgi:cellulose synthase/poly-beta-1,6-N-acetylglucosamine synthase-like glycosyltransferase
MIEIPFLILGVFYFSLIISFFIGIQNIKRQKPAPRQSSWRPSVSVLIPARDEADSIVQTLDGLSRQTYPSDKMEVLIIDDHSMDNTAEVIDRFISDNNLSHFKLLRHHLDGIAPTYKKAAIAFALQSAKGEIIMTTDADCILQPDWVESMIGRYDEQTGMVAGLITFHPDSEKNIFNRLQTLEFAGVVFAGGGAVGLGKPLICNGSNLSYRRQAYEDVDGFKGHDHLPSGDDDLLMQNIRKKTDWKIKYNLDGNSINYTRPVSNLNRFLNQRSRWASKGVHYPGLWISIMLFLIYLFYASLFVVTPMTIIGSFSASILLAGFLLKLIPEFLLVHQALSILNRKDLLPLFFLAEVLQIPYVVIVGFRGFFNLFKWKNG